MRDGLVPGRHHRPQGLRQHHEADEADRTEPRQCQAGVSLPGRAVFIIIVLIRTCVPATAHSLHLLPVQRGERHLPRALTGEEVIKSSAKLFVIFHATFDLTNYFLIFFIPHFT